MQEKRGKQTPQLTLLDQRRKIATGTDEQIGRDLHRVPGHRHKQRKDDCVDDDQGQRDVGPAHTGKQQVGEGIVIQGMGPVGREHLRLYARLITGLAGPRGAGHAPIKLFQYLKKRD